MSKKLVLKNAKQITVKPSLFKQVTESLTYLFEIEAYRKHHISEWKSCVKCPLGRFATNHVLFEFFPENAVQIDVLFIGEAPGKFEDIKGLPFVGPSGKFLKQAISRAREEEEVKTVTFGFTNTVACRPADSAIAPNRPPNPNEVVACAPRLVEMFKLWSIKSVVLVGNTSRDNVGPALQAMGFKGKVYTVFHPAFFLRSNREQSPKYPEFLETIKEAFYAASECS